VALSATAADIGIVGAGPAGATAARALARSGARVLLFDHSHPREKPCGGGVTGRALSLVADAIDRTQCPLVDIESVEFDDSRARPVRVPLGPRDLAGPPLIVVDRRSFDGQLLDAAVAAGATHVAERVVDVEAMGPTATLRTTAGNWRVDRVIGADGPNSIVRRRLGRPFTRHDLSIASGVFVHGVSSRDVLIRFVAEPSGYIWSFPRRDHLAVGICAQADQSTARQLRELLRGWLPGKLVTEHTRVTRYGWPIPSLDAATLEQQRTAGERWLLAGDAAGLVDPITREGIFFALQSGLFAACSLVEARAATRRYCERLRDEIYPELARAARLKAGFFRGAFTRLLVDALAHSRAVRDIMADLVAGRQPYATLKRRLLGTCHLGLAWRLLMLEVGRN
jgi:geranylgeranyl reductase family protein